MAIQVKAFACASENRYQEGMDLRDYFAAKAMQGLIGRGVWTKGQISEQAYNMADAMMEQRTVNQEP